MFRFGKRSVFWKWIISYICIVMILMLCNMITYARNWDMMKERQNQMNQVVLQQLIERVYDNALQLEKIQKRILVNDHYLFLRRATARQYNTLAYRRYALYTDIQDYQAVNGRCSKIIVYFEDGDYVVASDTVNTSKLYWQVFGEEIGLDRESWRELLKGSYNTFYTQKTSSNGEEGLIYARTLQTGQFGWQNINVFFLYTADDLRQMLAGHTGEEVLSAALKESNGEVVLLDMGGLFATQEDRERVEQAIEEELPGVTLADGEEIMLAYEKSALTGTVCLISSENMYMEGLRKARNMYTVTFAATILLSTVLIVLFAKRNYKPLQELMEVLGPEEWVSVRYKNEFALVQDRVSEVQDENKRVNLTLRRQNRLFRSEYFAKLLTGNKVNLPEDKIEEFYDISFISDKFAVMLFYVENYEEEREDGMDLDRAQFILGNVFQEMLESFLCKVYQARISDLMVLVVNIPEKEPECKAMLDKTIQEGGAFMNRHFNMGYSVSISAIHTGVAELAAAYQEALQAMDAKRLYGLDDMVYYSDIIAVSTTGYYYPIEMEQEMIRQIQASNYEGADAIYKNIAEQNMNSKTLASQDSLRCLMYDLLGTVLKALGDKKEDEDYARELRPVERMSACQGISEMQGVFEGILLKTCEYMGVKSGTEDNETLCEQIQEYIRKNYFNPNLSVTSIAEHFSLPPVMMSRMFRETVGEKIPVIVSEIRLEAAKKLMCQSEGSLGEVAEKAGFGSVRTFTRIFKQVEGCTPGQWRENRPQ